MPRKKGLKVIRLESELRKLLRGGEWKTSEPLPVTRELAEQYDVSNVTVHRVMRQLRDEGLLWRNENGRYFLPGAREMAERPKPVLCLIRELSAWFASYQLLLQGFSTACSEARRSLLIPSGLGLLQHEAPEVKPVFSGSSYQLRALRRVLRTNPQAPQGILLDHLWHEDVLEACVDDLRNAVIVWRATRVKGVSSVRIDPEEAVRQALDHLKECGYDRILIAVPFLGDSAVDSIVDAAVRVGRDYGVGEQDVWQVDTDRGRARLMLEIQDTSERIGIFCIEDNVGKLLLEGVRGAGLRCPQDVGILSGMGTEIALDAGLSSVQIPFSDMGERAARLINERESGDVVLPTRLLRNLTT